MAKEYIEREAAIVPSFRYVLPNGEISPPVVFVKTLLHSIPAADVRPVVHGRWTKKNDDVCYWFECSVCGQRPPWNEWGTEWQSPFCPNCGADMREES